MGDSRRRESATSASVAGLMAGAVALSVGATSCGASPPEVPIGELCDAGVRAALTRLIEQGDDSWAFVIVEHPPSEDYVQFALEEDGLFTDLPTIPLTHDEQERAKVLFAEIGVQDPVVVRAPVPGTKDVTTVETFQARFGDDVERACRFAGRVFREVYLMPEGAPLSITEDDR